MPSDGNLLERGRSSPAIFRFLMLDITIDIVWGNLGVAKGQDGKEGETLW